MTAHLPHLELHHRLLMPMASTCTGTSLVGPLPAESPRPRRCAAGALVHRGGESDAAAIDHTPKGEAHNDNEPSHNAAVLTPSLACTASIRNDRASIRDLTGCWSEGAVKAAPEAIFHSEQPLVWATATTTLVATSLAWHKTYPAHSALRGTRVTPPKNV
jgi:hypothetical protein